MNEIIPLSWEERLLDDLEKAFPNDNISTIYVFTDPRGNRQSLLLNEKKISFSWSPPVDKIDTEGSYKAILDRCTEEINNAKKK
tara:strand:- start:151 stop:402 length:252 start_codon:yes stop_codon:yes gene_type:complete